VTLVPLLFGIALATREIRVEWLARGEGSLRQAVLEQQSRRILPAANASYLLWLADATPDAVERLNLLREAIAADRRSVSAWIRAGLELEQAGKIADAEKALLEAAHLDRQLLPAWTLANFYFRQKNDTEFWKWGAHAAALTYDDYRPLLQLADLLEPDADALLARLNAGPKLTRAYLDFLIGRQRLDAAQQAGRALLRFNDVADRQRIAGLADRQLAAGRTADAAELRNALGDETGQ